MEKITRFQKKVLRAVCKIPKGEVRSYKWIAQEIGAPGASRAVGNALAKNPFPVEIPCHRVIKSDGSLGGYSAKGGVKEKLELLRKEGFCGKVSTLNPRRKIFEEG